MECRIIVMHFSIQVLTGILMNIICVGIVVLTLNTLGIPIFELSSYPIDVLGNCTDSFY